jgi:3-oxoadipate enol-lactonase
LVKLLTLKGRRALKELINGFQMNYTVSGDGPALLFVHGFPLDHTLWDHQIPFFDQSYQVIAPDLRGHGKSEVPSGPYSMDQMADDLAALMDRLQVERVILAGLSMGGYITLAFWRLYPHRVRALALIDTRAGADTPEGRKNRYETAEQVRIQGTEAMVEGMLPKLLSLITLGSKPEIVAHARQMMDDTPAGGVIGALEGMALRPDSTPTLQTISVPTLIVVGEEDKITPPEEAEAMQSGIQAGGQSPSVTLARIMDAGHLSPLENPEAFNHALQGFLSSLSR